MLSNEAVWSICLSNYLYKIYILLFNKGGEGNTILKYFLSQINSLLNEAVRIILSKSFN